MTEQKIGGSFYPLTLDITAKLRKGKLTAAEWRIWSYLVEIDPWGDRYIKINTIEIIQECSVSKATFYRAIAKFQELRVVPEATILALKKISYSNIEQQVRDNLKAILGGQSEVMTSSGRIDLLSDREIIEIKQFNNWKEALGQIFTYSAFFPTYNKRIHLFGSATALKKLPDIEAACLPFEVLVTGQEVEND
ncbi:hypothetical protein SAMD00079811_78160 (plasmid) [Scytonema sp. HK-05]|uniref:hypothetical protein n=1 Tax=Scytonema sp. HK-05 TaxID=1137095 RepID=UPI00093690CC|nr:hypothetical protein [Scytonema sp. HK-05]OKH56546.1 hypothetical protein NIES2130_24655 [Scytonema sp. HK-05]BAY50187.1 hypothetical protein SAMD00079811_78160 [Scytonema sp. HK-05]